MKITPTSRLLFWTGMVLLPFSTLATALPSAFSVSATLISLFLSLVFADSFFARKSPDGIRLVIPETVRLSRGRDGDMEVRIRNGKSKSADLRIAFAFPKEILTSGSLSVRLPPDSPLSFFRCPCRGMRQGHYRLEKSCMEFTSPLGLWNVRTTTALNTEIRVFPDLISEQQGLAALFLRNHSGIHSRRFLGKGRDFDRLREYLPGDSFEDIHWKATAKRGRPVTRIWQMERTQQIYVITDSSRLSARLSPSGGISPANPRIPDEIYGKSGDPLPIPESGGKGNEMPDDMPGDGNDYRLSIMERYVTSALLMGLAARRQGDQFGVLTFSNRVKDFIRAGNGKNHYQICRDRLCSLEAERVTPDFAEVFTFIGTRIRRRALLIFLTHLDDPAIAENFISHVDIIRRHHLVMIGMIRPDRAAPLFCNPDIGSVSGLYSELGGHMLWSSLQEVEKVLRRRGVGFFLAEAEKLSAGLVSRYLEIKQRQRL